GTCCLRFKNGVATIHAKLASGWLARLYREGVEPSGSLQKVSDRSLILLFWIYPGAREVSWRPSLNDATLHSALMFAARITLAHFSVSSEMSFPKSAGEPKSGVPPKSASRPFILGSARAALISLLSLPMTSAGVPVGTPTPYQVLAS